MDMKEIGKFLAELRHEYGLTQEQLGEELGVTNKTVSRWENGDYFPPIDILLELSKKYNISINEILSAKKLTAEDYKEKAEENLKTTLSKSSFTTQERMKYFSKKWDKDHCLEMVIEMLGLLALAITGLVLKEGLFVGAAFILSLAWSLQMHNRKSAYIENVVFDGNDNDLSTQEKNEVA
ncbi:MAG: helix-turn-helix transcriptional regulator [Anaeroplasmataceae bacterium]|nr:helix-turn-helix transcriptional regulator [Anaeroplasmataceae bacterium]